MKFCTNCGSQLEAGDKFCTNCGSAVVTAPKVEEVPEVETPVTPEVEKAVEETPVAPQVEKVVEEEAPVTPEVKEVAEPETKVEPEVEAPVAPESTKTESKINIDKEAVNERVQQTKEYAQSYWNWVKTSVQKPFEAQKSSHPFYGITTFVLFSIIGALFIIIPGRQAFSKFNETTSDYGVGSIMNNPFSIGMFLKLLITIAIVYALYVVIGFLIVKFLSVEDGKVSIFEYTNNFAHFINYTLIFSIVALLMMVLSTQSIINNLDSGVSVPGSLKLVVTLLAIATLGFNTGFLATFFDKNMKFKIDRIYVVMIAQLVVVLIAFILVRYMIVPNVESYTTGLFGDALSSLSDLF